MKTAVIYNRLEMAEDELFLDILLSNIREYAAHNSYEIIKTFTEEFGKPDNNGRTMGKLAECITYCKKVKPDVVLVPHIRDLGNGYKEILNSLREFNKIGESVYFGDLGVQTLQEGATPEYVGKVVLPMINAVIDADKKFLVKRQSLGRKKYKEEGGHLGRPKGSSNSLQEYREKYAGVFSRIAAEEKNQDIADKENVSLSTVKKIKRTVKKEAGVYVKMTWAKLMEYVNNMTEEKPE